MKPTTRFSTTPDLRFMTLAPQRWPGNGASSSSASISFDCTSEPTRPNPLRRARTADTLPSERSDTHGARMTYVIVEACIGVKDRACVDVCPVDCIYEGDDMLYIHPDECIDC